MQLRVGWMESWGCNGELKWRRNKEAGVGATTNDEGRKSREELRSRLRNWLRNLETTS